MMTSRTIPLARALPLMLAVLVTSWPAAAAPATSLWRLGFYWSPTQDTFPPALVPWSMYTHISQMAILPTPSCGIDEKWYRANEVREDLVRVAHANDVKVTITLMQDAAITAMVECTRPTKIAAFVSVLTAYVVANGYDGLDLDWEGKVVPPQYRDLVVRLRRAMPGKILTADIAMHQRGYLVDLQDELDRINVMSYDLWTSDYDGRPLDETWHHAALLSGGDKQFHQTAEAGLSYVLGSGIRPGKVNLAVPFYGYAFEGCQKGFDTGLACTKSLLAPLDLIGRGGLKKTQVEFNKVMEVYGRGDIRWDDVHKSPYIAFKASSIPGCSARSCPGDAFVTYTDARQMAETINFITSRELGGIMTFALHQEFMADAQGPERYPLSSAMYMALALKGKL